MTHPTSARFGWQLYREASLALGMVMKGRKQGYHVPLSMRQPSKMHFRQYNLKQARETLWWQKAAQLPFIWGSLYLRTKLNKFCSFLPPLFTRRWRSDMILLSEKWLLLLLRGAARHRVGANVKDWLKASLFQLSDWLFLSNDLKVI